MDKKLATLFEHIENKQNDYVSRLAEAVSMKSVGGTPDLRDECFKMVNWTKAHLDRLGAKTELFPIPKKQTVCDGREIDYPPVILASIYDGKAGSAKKTICVFGHLDCQSAIKVNEHWETEPFKLTEIDGKLYGRGATDDKGPVCAWLNCVEAYRETLCELPVNIKFVFDCMEGSDTLDLAIIGKPEFFEDVTFVCISDNYWTTTTKPCLTYGLRGSSYFHLSVECAKSDLHSGLYGGAVHEAMADLIAVFDSLTTADGTIKIAGLNELVAPLTPAEDKLYDGIEFNVEDYWKKETGASRLLNDLQNDTKKLLLKRWRYPSLSLHGIEHAFWESGSKTVIPRRVIGKFSIRLVPNMDPREVERLMRSHIEAEFKHRNSPNKWNLEMVVGLPPWIADVKHFSYEAGRRATKRVWGVEPDMTREGGTMPAALPFESLAHKFVMLLPMGQSDDGAHSNKEKISRRNYINGAKLFAAFLEESAVL